MLSVNSDVGNYRSQNEDTFIIEEIIIEDTPVLLFGIFDGHGGKECSKFLEDNLTNYLEMSLTVVDDVEQVESTLIKVCDLLNKDFLNTFSESFAGSCALFGLLYQMDDGEYRLLTTNIGDSIGIIAERIEGDRYKAIQLNRLHKPSDPEEKEYLEESGYMVQGDRFFGLAVSRAFGDKDIADKGMKCVPEFTFHKIKKDYPFFVFGSDGLWDVVSYQQVMELVHSGYNAKDLSDFALDSGSTDNVTVIIGRFSHQTS